MDVVTLFADFVKLAGLAGVSTVLINVAKTFGVVKDGQAPGLVVIGNAVLFLVFTVLKVFSPALDWGAVDSNVTLASNLLLGLVALLAQMGLSKAWHFSLKGLPFIGKSFSGEAAKSAKAQAGG